MKKRAILLFSMIIFLASCSRFLISYPDRIKAYTTNDPGRPYKPLGPVEATFVPAGYYKKSSIVPVRSMERNYEKYGDTRWHHTSRIVEAPPVLTPDYQGANRILLDVAYDRFGTVLGAVINIRYTNSVEYYNKEGLIDMNSQRLRTTAVGLAVCFVDRQNKCINFDESDSSSDSKSKPKAGKPAPKTADSSDDDEEDDKPIPAVVTQPEKTLIPATVLGIVLKGSRTSTDYDTRIIGYKKSHEYDFGDFFIRIFEFNSSKNAADFLALASRLPNASLAKKGYYWLSNFTDCLKCSNLVYRFDQTKIITVYPGDQTLVTALRIEKFIRQK